MKAPDSMSGAQPCQKVFTQTKYYKNFIKKTAKPSFLHLVAARVTRKRREDASERGLFCRKTEFLDSLKRRTARPALSSIFHRQANLKITAFLCGSPAPGVS